MPNETFKDVIAARDRLAARLRERFSPRHSVAAGTEHTLLESLADRLEAAKNARKEALERHDEEIRYYTAAISDLQASLAKANKLATRKDADQPKAASARKGVSRRQKSGGRKPAPSARRKPPPGNDG